MKKTKKMVNTAFRLHQEHIIALSLLAELEGEPKSVMLRKLIREAAIKKGVWPIKNIKKGTLPQIYKEET